MKTPQQPTMQTYILVGALCLAFITAAHGAVMVGNSTVIGTLDYSDTWTGGTSTNRTIENSYGNPSQTWAPGSNPFGSINTDSTASSTSQSPYPGNSGAGSATGITQKGSGGNFGIAYGLRTDFVLQTDAVQLNTGGSIQLGAFNAFSGSDGILLNIAVNANGSTGYTLFNPVAGNGAVSGAGQSLNTATGLTSNTWNNYAMEFNLNTKILTLYINQVNEGTINLNIIDGGVFASHIDTSANGTVEIGGTFGTGTSNRLWTDNFQIGSVVAVPEPKVTTLVLGSAMLLGMAGVWRRRAIAM